VILILSLICQVLVDSISLSGALACIGRIGVPAAAVVISAGFFLFVGPPRSERPNGSIQLVYVGAVTIGDVDAEGPSAIGN
jgi:hypothetical protein